MRFFLALSRQIKIITGQKTSDFSSDQGGKQRFSKLKHVF